jgi:hypothetical protein
VPAKAKPRNFDDVKKLATLPTRVVSLCLAGELVEEATRLERQLGEAPPPTSVGDGTRRILAEQLAAVTEQMRDATVDFRLKAMPSREWSRFWAGMPAPDEQQSNVEWSERMFPFYAEMVARVCVDPVMSVEQVGELADVLHGKAWTRLVNACMGVNMGEVDVPNSAAVSDLTGTSGQT